MIQDLSVLVVDDNQTNRVILVEMLSAWGMRPQTAAGRQNRTRVARARSRARHAFPFGDYRYADAGNGWLQLERGNSPEFRFRQGPDLLLSSSVGQGEAARCRQLGVASWLTKPVQPSELLDAILAALSKPTETPQPSPAPLDTALDETPRMKVLLAEDNAVNRKLATTLLEKRGHIVVVTENGQEALDALERENVDLVLMDVQMPVMDGFEAIHAIRAKERSTGAHLPIIAVTAHAMKGDRERCLEAGADDYVTKPIRLAELLAAMNRARSGVGGRAPVVTPVAASTAVERTRYDVGA